MRSLLLASVLALLFAAGARADEPTYTIVPSDTDPAIVDTVPQTRGNNIVYLPAAHPVGKLLVFLPSGGATNLPTEFKQVATQGALLGYDTIVLAYRNEVGINAAPPAGCGPAEAPPASPPNCAYDVHRELLDGNNESSVITVDKANAIENRLTKLLQYLVLNHSDQRWANYLDGAAPKWPEIVIAGQSLGSGESVLIGMLRPVFRVAMFAGFTDAAHGWVAPGLTPTSRYSAIINRRDNFYPRTCTTYVALGLATACPLSAFPDPLDHSNPLLAENRVPPYRSRQLVFNLEPNPAAPVVADPYHSSTSRDGWVAREADGSVNRQLINIWRSNLGDSDADTFLDIADNCPTVPNPTQLASACSTSATGAPGGSVPATLSLTLGSAATFGAFTPGVDRNYDTSTTANVISTAGDGTLSVSDPAATGRLVNGTFSLTEPLQARASSAAGTGAALAPLGASALSLLTYAGPVSNDAVTIAFRQHIGTTQALRTGAYTKTLTFTLSTTTP